MPKTNQGKGGNKHRKQAKSRSAGGDEEKRELILKEDGQEYAIVTKLLGGCRVEAQCFDGTSRLALIRGNMKKKVWIFQGDLILLGLRDFQDNKADVIHKYTAADGRKLKSCGELPESVQLNDKIGDNNTADDDVPFDFEDI